jgi:MYXO-CTERM domain-containing protein
MTMRRSSVSCVALVATLALAKAAAAQDAGRGEIPALEAELARAASALATGACAVACPALASMKRAADRICALEPGPRCDAARAKVREAQRRVEEACPDCIPRDHEEPAKAKADDVSKERKDSPPPPAPPAEPASSQMAPAPRRGGCASCEVGVATEVPRGLGAALVVLALALRRRRRPPIVI